MSKKLNTPARLGHGIAQAIRIGRQAAVPTTEIPGALQPRNSMSSTIPVVDAADTVLAILEDVGKLVKDVPYIEGIAGILSGVIKIHQEMRDKEEYCKEMLGDVLDMSSDILSQLQAISLSTGKDRLEPFRNDLMKYHQLLREVYSDLKQYHQDYQNRSKLIKWAYRKPDAIKKIEKKVKKFKDEYDRHAILNIAMMIATDNPPKISPVLPPPWTPIPIPAPMFGRDNELKDMLSHLMSNKPLRIAILGPGGMGKTTLALHFLNTGNVINHYPSQLFISCEGRNSLDELLLDIAEQVRIPSEQRKEYLQDQILGALKKCSTVICLDNLETLWEPATLHPWTYCDHTRKSEAQWSHLASAFVKTSTRSEDREFLDDI
ncbi:hypothetical protein M422DRAFT_270075 [Sphaerobolus stellatus SS14]|uniref:NB-ARC domain-containing protein n=1 Tax=Sphaerobolus stellatus (strain SS14) TaxID=990650 RepID=A0A0C9TGV1_SPHS4|nr:hypothetical protein M422DRAFT_270075 [Sphaerobolus stellatus SS14]